MDVKKTIPLSLLALLVFSSSSVAQSQRLGWQIAPSAGMEFLSLDSDYLEGRDTLREEYFGLGVRGNLRTATLDFYTEHKRYTFNHNGQFNQSGTSYNGDATWNPRQGGLKFGMIAFSGDEHQDYLLSGLMSQDDIKPHQFSHEEFGRDVSATYKIPFRNNSDDEFRYTTGKRGLEALYGNSEPSFNYSEWELSLLRAPNSKNSSFSADYKRKNSRDDGDYRFQETSLDTESFNASLRIPITKGLNIATSAFFDEEVVTYDQESMKRTYGVGVGVVFLGARDDQFFQLSREFDVENSSYNWMVEGQWSFDRKWDLHGSLRKRVWGYTPSLSIEYKGRNDLSLSVGHEERIDLSFVSALHINGAPDDSLGYDVFDSAYFSLPVLTKDSFLKIENKGRTNDWSIQAGREHLSSRRDNTFESFEEFYIRGMSVRKLNMNTSIGAEVARGFIDNDAGSIHTQFYKFFLERNIQRNLKVSGSATYQKGERDTVGLFVDPVLSDEWRITAGLSYKFGIK